MTIFKALFISLFCFKPSFTQTTHRYAVAAFGGNVTIRCSICLFTESTFFAESRFSWSGPGNTLPNGRYTLESNNTELTIIKVTASDEGNYTCNALFVPTSERHQHLYEIIIGASPSFLNVSDGPHNVSVTEGDSITFNCKASAKPEAKIVWLQDGRVIDPDAPPKRFAFSKGNKSLTIRDVCRNCPDRESKTDLAVIQCNASNDVGYAFASGYMNVLKKYCDKEVDAEHSIFLNTTIASLENLQPCPGNTTGFCSRKCFLNKDGDAVLSQPNCNSCVDKEYKELLERVNDLVTNTSLNQTEVANIASQLSILTNESKGLTAGNLNASVMVINRLAVFRNVNNNPSEEEINSTVQAISNILQPSNSKSWKALQAVNSAVAMAVLFSADVYAQSLSTNNKSNHSTTIADYMVLETWSLQKSNLSLQLEFPSGSFWGENSSDRISISVETLDNSSSSISKPTLNIWGLYYRTIHNYLPGKKDSDIINSRVLSLSIGGLNTKENLKRPVLIVLQHNQAESISYRRTCAFWNFTGGEWDSTGCSVTSTNFTHTICSCDHLTNFAILMSRYPSYDKVLSIISIVGCSISVIGLILTVIFYAITWKQSRSSQTTVLLNICVALIIAYIIFMAGANKVDSKNGCKAVAVLLHYFFLAAFFLMLAEGVQLLLYLVFVFHVRRTIETILLVAAAWVLPLIIVGISAGSTRANGYGNGQACWLSGKDGLMWAFIGPVLCIITANFVILAIVLIRMCQSRIFLAKNKEKRDKMRATIWNLSVTCPVLGLGWLFGVLSVAFDSVVFQYLFVIANSVQGLLIFIFHALPHNKKIREKISYVYSSYISRRRNPDSTQVTLSQTPEMTPKLGCVERTVQHIGRIEMHYYSTTTQNTSISDSSTLDSPK